VANVSSITSTNSGNAVLSSSADFTAGSPYSVVNSTLTTAFVAANSTATLDSMVAVDFVGWSEGAGLGLAATADAANKTIFGGLVARQVFGMSTS
jgi:hypothetical protein